ncbi:major facilitator superfamily domain-containing protein 10 [Lithobates pipiens]
MSNKAVMPPKGEDQGSTRVITVIFLALLIDLLGFTLILPLMPSILDHFGKSNDSMYQTLQGTVGWFAEAVGVPQERKYNSVLFGGLIGSLFSLLQFICSPLTGAASDYLGRRRVMMINSFGIIVSYAVWAMSRNFGVFLISRIIGGLSKGNVSLCAAVIADLPSLKNRSKGMAMIGVAFSVGFTIGPMVGAYFAINAADGEVFYVRPALLALTFSVVDLLFIILFLPETLPKEKRVSSVIVGCQGALDLISPVSLFQFSAITRREDFPSNRNVQNLRMLGLVYFLYLFFFSGLEYTISFLTHQRFQFNSMQQGKMFFFIGITMALIQGGYARRIKPGNEVKVVKQAMILLVPAFLLIGWANGLFMLGLGLLLYSFAAAIVVPCLSSMVSTYGSASQKGTVMGILRSLGCLARAVGPVLAATLYWVAGAEFCFTVCSLSFVFPLLFLKKVTSQGKEE